MSVCLCLKKSNIGKFHTRKSQDKRYYKAFTDVKSLLNCKIDRLQEYLM